MFGIRKMYLLISLACVALMSAVYAVFFSIQSSTSPIAFANPKPVNLNGQWHQTKSGIPNTIMSAEISDNKIVIDEKLGEVDGVFWIGTFNPNDPDDAKTFTVTSEGDVKTMAHDLLASNEKSKVFTYKNGDLSFQYSIMGVSTIVHLSRGEN